ncbi:MAG: purine-nucleoside phosphorylase [Paracoccaceae bacterium]|nr:purine-nucleoside phosphorylase [Paracoccaceae bacterium]
MKRKLNSKDISQLIGNAPVRVGLVLGSGLGGILPLKEVSEFDYEELADFDETSVTGHQGKLMIGSINETKVAILSGRTHYYENGKSDTMREPIEFLTKLGISHLFLTNAAGSLKQNIPTGSLMVIKDHINFSGLNPLIGEKSEERFVNLTKAYNNGMIEAIFTAAKENNLKISQGVYAWFSGPSFETPAEIKALNMLGADAVGMSTVPETILANFFGLKVAAISIITNMAAGLSEEKISHDQTKHIAKSCEKKLQKLLISLLRNFK